MYLRSLSSALPRHVFSQAECWEILAEHGPALGLRDRSLMLLERILLGDSGIDERHFALGDPGVVFGSNSQQLNEAFEVEAPLLAGQALEKALNQAGMRAAELDALFICTCTGYLCPGVSSHVAERLGMRSDAYLQDLVGLGCGAAIPLLRSAGGFLAAGGEARTVATVSVEICSAAFYVDNDPGVLISLCLFGDGASASIWESTPRSGAWKVGEFHTMHRPEDREKIRFVNAGGKLRNQLHRSVPELAAQSVKALYGRCAVEPDHVLCHGGGRDVLQALERALNGRVLGESWEILRRCGNVSSSSVMLALEERLSQVTEEERLWASSFGAGFSAHSCEFVRLT